MIRDKLAEATRDALRAQDKPLLSALRMVTSSVKNADIEARGTGKGELSEDALLSLFQKLIKQRQESAEMYDKGGRPELAAGERAEIAVIQSFMPKQMEEADVAAAIDDAIRESGAASIKDMGKVMALLRQRYAGRMDFAKVGGVLKGRL
ncbi:MAG TPA: GatB/YqeY domain-containing protein, partial [Bauldia sp.]|nr:GatB/YqeY domain-containing protein [Bauldia sp.]